MYGNEWNMDAKINEQVKNKKQDNMITPEIRYKKTAKGMMITEYSGTDSYVVLPDEIEGEAVTALDDYAFARNLEVEEIWLPEDLKEVGRYVFYRCRNLKKLVMGNQLLDMGGGALTGCHLTEVEIYFREGKKSCLKSIVEEMRYQIRVNLYGYSWRYDAGEEKNCTDGQMWEARILFPEHYEEAVENTPARILETHHHGAGGYYRQCFYNRELDYKKYDEMFYHTVAEDTEETAVELALNRLRFPEELSEKNKNVYKTYIREHMETVAAYLVKREDIEGIRFLEQKKLWSEPSLQKGMDVAAEGNRTESLSVLMDVRKELFPKKKKTFEL